MSENLIHALLFREFSDPEHSPGKTSLGEMIHLSGKDVRVIRQNINGVVLQHKAIKNSVNFVNI